MKEAEKGDLSITCSSSNGDSFQLSNVYEVVDAFGRERRLIKLKNR
jgi:hypothetical protein